MDSVSDIWNGILGQLGNDLTPTAMNTWFADCVPVEISENCLVLHTTTEFKRDILRSRFSEPIRNALYDLFCTEMDVLILAGDELQSFRSRNRDPFAEHFAGYTFQSFVVGPSNQYAHAAALGVAEHPGHAYNPLFIYGNSGLGKTHLLLAIGQYVREHDPSARIAYLKGDEFTNELVDSIRDNTQGEFRKKYRCLDLLLIDDVQFIAGKIQTQEEFFHTFNSLYEAGKQIVITADRPPMEMAKLEERLRTRFEGGLMADVQPPDLETRMAITRNKGAQLGLILDEDVVLCIAENVTANIRQLEGVVKRLTAYRSILNDAIDTDSVKRAIKDVIRLGVYIPTPAVIIEETARYYSLEPSDLRGQRRSKNTAMARQISMYLIRTLTNLSLKDIGEQYEDRNHSTVLNSIRKVEGLISRDPDTAAAVRDITSNINSHS